MKVIFALCISLFLFNPQLIHAEEAAADTEKQPFGFNVELMTGMFLGGTDELVYQKGRDHELSRLEWEENFVPYLELIGGFDFWNFFTTVSVITSIPVRSGVMRDYDFMLANSNDASHYSEHDSMFDKHLEIYPEIGWGADIGRWYLGAAAGFIYRNRKWSAVDGYTQYPAKIGEPWSSDMPKEQQSGTIITYEEALWAPSVSLYVDFSITKNTTIGFLGTFYPYLNVTTIDTHLLRQTQFRDKMQGGWGILAGLDLHYSPKTSDIVDFRFGFGYEGMFPARGSSASGELGANAGLIVADEIESQMRSNLFWVHVGVCVYPARLFTKK